MKGIKDRLIAVGLIAFAIGTFYILLTMFNTTGATAASIPNADKAWGFQWTAANLGWVALVVVIAFCAGFILWSIYKARRN